MKQLIVLLINLLILPSCTSSGSYLVRWWNGDIIPRSTVEEAAKAEAEYYESESDEKKKLRKKNEVYCNEYSEKIYLKLLKKDPKLGNSIEGDIFFQCMINKRTPTYAYRFVTPEKGGICLVYSYIYICKHRDELSRYGVFDY